MSNRKDDLRFIPIGNTREVCEGVAGDRARQGLL